MEQLLARLPSNRQAPGAISPRFETALHVFADAKVFRLDLVAYGDALRVVSAARVAYVTEIEIEYDPAMIYIDGNHQIRVHVAFVTIDHEIRILPEIPGAIAFARRPCGGIFFRGDHRARLQAIAIFVFDGVLLVVENAIQAFVEMRHVITTIEVVIDKYLPVAGDIVRSAVEIMELGKSEGSTAFH